MDTSVFSHKVLNITHVLVTLSYELTIASDWHSVDQRLESALLTGKMHLKVEALLQETQTRL